MSETSIPQDVTVFIRSSITSIWALELLLFLARNPREDWSVDQLVRELRGSRLLVTGIIASLRRSGLVSEETEDAFRYCPASETVADLVVRLEQLSIEKPMAVRNIIISAPHDKIQVFADAFRVRKD